jgi:hypothetical protein
MDKFDRLYRTTIGARVSEVQQDAYTSSCVCDAPHWIEPIVTPLSWWQTDCSAIAAQYTYDPGVTCEVVQGGGIPLYTWRHKDSDGVALAESQMLIPQATFAPQQLNNSTHMSVRNDRNTEILLRNVFSGRVGTFFTTQEKEH